MQFFLLWAVKLALNLAMEAEKKGILKKYKIELIGANSKAISKC